MLHRIIGGFVQLTVYKDLFSIAFIRCVTPIAGSAYFAEGTGFSIEQAKAKCISERVEREFVLRTSLNPIGIAAHPDCNQAYRHATNEATETLLLEKIAYDKFINGLHIGLGKQITISISKVNGLWFTLLSSKRKPSPVFTYAVRPSLLFSLLQTWSEFRNILIYQPNLQQMKNYTKANKLFSNQLKLKNSTVPYLIELSSMTFHQEKIKNHFVSYYNRKEDENE